MPGGRRDVLDTLLTQSEKRAIAAQCKAADVPFDRWHLCGLARGWELLVFARLTRRIAKAETVTLTRAEYEAAGRIGISRETLLSRRKELPRAAYRAAS